MAPTALSTKTTTTEICTITIIIKNTKAHYETQPNHGVEKIIINKIN